MSNATASLARDPDRSERANRIGIAAIVATAACFVVGDVCVKLATQSVPIGELVLLRGIVSTLLMLLLAIRTGALVHARRALTGVMTARTTCDIAATHLFFTAISMMPIADATAIGQFTPLAVTAAAAILLGERVGWRRWLATLVGLVGVLIIVRPGSSSFDWAALLVIGCVLSVAVRDVLTRQIADDIPVPIVALITLGAVTVSGLARGLAEAWVWPDLTGWLLIVAAAVANCGGYYCIVIAMRNGDIAVVSPFRYTAILFAVLMGYIVFGETPDALTFLGIAIVIGAGLYTLHRERVRGVLAAAPQTAASGRPS